MTWELCPKCHGQGTVSKPPYLPGDVQTWASSDSTPHICDVCNGKRIISSVTGQPPKWDKSPDSTPPNVI